MIIQTINKKQVLDEIVNYSGDGHLYDFINELPVIEIDTTINLKSSSKVVESIDKTFEYYCENDCPVCGICIAENPKISCLPIYKAGQENNELFKAVNLAYREQKQLNTKSQQELTKCRELLEEALPHLYGELHLKACSLLLKDYSDIKKESLTNE